HLEFCFFIPHPVVSPQWRLCPDKEKKGCGKFPRPMRLPVAQKAPYLRALMKLFIFLLIVEKEPLLLY
ncbi:hypothetical protein, partial [Bacillus litorisediminis]|uniref:hypothetical protein n=1 Tax=Bacillus litorisediminis TaxID=2922713 RepID=UPI001FAF0B07